MKRKIFFASAAIILAIGGIVATKANPPLPDYYINNAGNCVAAPVTECTGSGTCLKEIDATQGFKQIYDQRSENTCLQPLNE